MLVENPYQAPEANCQLPGSALLSQSYPPGVCPYCLGKMKVWDLLKPTMPRRFSCSRCGQKSRETAERLALAEILIAVEILLPVVAGILAAEVTRNLLYFFVGVLGFIVSSIVTIIRAVRFYLSHVKLVPLTYSEAFDTAQHS